MINITLSMILCDGFDYHILCVFSAAQIRKLAVSDLSSTRRRTAARKHNICHSISGIIFYMLC
ncbi:TPA: hypothetical protein F6U33_25215 [Citrobacter freundii]|nr:hypothetical protein [Citrobacter freundii]HAU5695097.1 hypothetical protein [Citrobacter freundii]